MENTQSTTKETGDKDQQDDYEGAENEKSVAAVAAGTQETTVEVPGRGGHGSHTRQRITIETIARGRYHRRTASQKPIRDSCATVIVRDVL